MHYEEQLQRRLESNPEHLFILDAGPVVHRIQRASLSTRELIDDQWYLAGRMQALRNIVAAYENLKTTDHVYRELVGKLLAIRDRLDPALRHDFNLFLAALEQRKDELEDSLQEFSRIDRKSASFTLSTLEEASNHKRAAMHQPPREKQASETDRDLVVVAYHIIGAHQRTVGIITIDEDIPYCSSLFLENAECLSKLYPHSYGNRWHFAKRPLQIYTGRDRLQLLRQAGAPSRA